MSWCTIKVYSSAVWRPIRGLDPKRSGRKTCTNGGERRSRMFNGARRRRRRGTGSSSSATTAIASANIKTLSLSSSNSTERRRRARSSDRATMKHHQGSGEPSAAWVMACAVLYVLSGVTQVRLYFINEVCCCKYRTFSRTYALPLPLQMLHHSISIATLNSISL